MKVTWDVEASCVYLVYPGPFDDARTRAALVAFGSHLNQQISRNPEAPVITRATYCTNLSYSPINLPFFVFAHVAPFRSASEVREWLTTVTDEAIDALDEKAFRRAMVGLKSLVTSSLLESHRFDYRMENDRVIGQHALNTAMLHYLRDGLSTEEYVALLESITFEEMRQILDEHLSPDNRRVVIVSDR
jgi:hypothetical protein